MISKINMENFGFQNILSTCSLPSSFEKYAVKERESIPIVPTIGCGAQ